MAKAAEPGAKPARRRTKQATAVAAPGKSPAERAYDRLILYIRNFETQLDQSQEIAMGFAGSEAGVLRIEGIGFYEPDIISFYGCDEDGMKTQLIQHVSQLSVILRAVPKHVPEEPPLRIGFRLSEGWRGGESGDGSAWPGPRAAL
ncbi:hypothetical protein XINFAN_01123 [Pseudogemmobacter humi]|uniref:Uncharacterized protein n=2 Tax=Pseudogemmobacter humi TaxID=2483812 RepID=A0A3P5WWW4_9RHOB|nr:hypothetical protein XINFAN_01123 [Pseudogemmobacter humi]